MKKFEEVKNLVASLEVMRTSFTTKKTVRPERVSEKVCRI